MQHKIYINGRFLQKPVTGTERFAHEIVRALDSILHNKRLGVDIKICAPLNTPIPDHLKVIKFETCGSRQGHAWEQWDLYHRTRDGILLSFTNSGPVFHTRQIVVIHDAAPYRIPSDFSFAYRIFHQILGKLLSKRARIATVSRFSRKELSVVFEKSEYDIPIFPNGHEHILRYSADNRVFENLSLTNELYFLFVGSMVARKNLHMAIKAFQSLKRDDVKLVIVGASNAKIFKDSTDINDPNIIVCGRLSDEEIVALYQNAHGLVFPSLYEGFGIPPLEAIVHGCPVIASDIPSMREVCDTAALYFDPNNMKECADSMMKCLKEPYIRDNLKEKGKKRYSNFSWYKSAELLLNELKSIA
jgi:glycosyltransferase involved in cell wall biosynthesis